MYDKIKKWYLMRLWTDTQVQNALEKEVITQEQYNEIISM